MSARRFVAVASCIAAMACGGSSSASITESQFGVNLGAALCARGIQCCCVSASAENTWIENQQYQGSLCASGSYPSILVTGNGSGTPPCTCIALAANGTACSANGSQGCVSGYCDQSTSVCAAEPHSSSLLDAQQCSSFFTPD